MSSNNHECFNAKLSESDSIARAETFEECAKIIDKCRDGHYFFGDIVGLRNIYVEKANEIRARLKNERF